MGGRVGEWAGADSAKAGKKLNRIAAQGLGHAVDAATCLGDFAGVDLGHLEAPGFQLIDQGAAVLGGDDPVLAEGHDIAAKVHGVLEGHRQDLDLRYQ